ncbi:MAG: hypothetical protein QHC90_24490 [Shinella sp.]|nr:hypothetical protein [Shinella sp.]
MAHDPSPGAAQPAPSSRPHGLVAIDGGDQRWKKLTEQANMAYARGDISLARSGYEAALAEAERLFEAAMERPGRFPAPVIYNVSCQNLAELENRHGDRSKAEAFYRKACDQLHDAARSPATSLAMRVACVQHLKPALAALAQHLQVHGAGEDALEEVIHRTYETALAVFRVARHAEHAGDDCPYCPIVPS